MVEGDIKSYPFEVREENGTKIDTKYPGTAVHRLSSVLSRV